MTETLLARPDSSTGTGPATDYVPRNAIEREILGVMGAECAAFYRGDYDGLARHWAHGPEVRRMSSGPHAGTRVHRGWEELSARMREGLRRYPQNVVARDWLRWENLQINATADMAWATYDLVLTRPNPDILACDILHETKIFQRIDGVWKIVCISTVVPDIGREDAPGIELDIEGRVARVNALAEARLRDHPGLMVSGARVRARNRAFDAGLQKEIRRVLALLQTNIVPGVSRRLSGAVPLGEDDHGRPLYCWVTYEQERVMVSFDDTHLVETRLGVAAEVYAFSPAQHGLALMLAKGTDLASAAGSLGVTVNTVRTHLRRMFEKTGTHTQTALVSTLLSVQRPG